MACGSRAGKGGSPASAAGQDGAHRSREALPGRRRRRPRRPLGQRPRWPPGLRVGAHQARPGGGGRCPGRLLPRGGSGKGARRRFGRGIAGQAARALSGHVHTTRLLPVGTAREGAPPWAARLPPGTPPPRNAPPASPASHRAAVSRSEGPRARRPDLPARGEVRAPPGPSRSPCAAAPSRQRPPARTGRWETEPLPSCFAGPPAPNSRQSWGGLDDLRVPFLPFASDRLKRSPALEGEPATRQPRRRWTPSAFPSLPWWSQGPAEPSSASTAGPHNPAASLCSVPRKAKPKEESQTSSRCTAALLEREGGKAEAGGFRGLAEAQQLHKWQVAHLSGPGWGVDPACLPGWKRPLCTTTTCLFLRPDFQYGGVNCSTDSFKKRRHRVDGPREAFDLCSCAGHPVSQNASAHLGF